MGWIYKDRYGFPGITVANINAYWHRKVRGDSEFESFDAFIKWCSENDYKPNARLRKHDEDKPHGPGNSYWYVKPPYQPVPKHGCISPFCENCGKKEDCWNGCSGWKDYFVKNWNDNISKSPKQKTEEVQEVFRYEHPDLVREGIVWTT